MIVLSQGSMRGAQQPVTGCSDSECRSVGLCEAGLAQK